MADQSVSVGAGLAWSWSRFRAAPWTLIGAAALWAVVLIAAMLVISSVVAIPAAFLATDETSPGAEAGLLALLTVFAIPVLALAASCWFNGIIALADRHTAAVGEFFVPRAYLPTLAVTAIVYVVSTCSQILFTIIAPLPWVDFLVAAAISVAAMWMYFYAVDVRASAATSISRGLTLTARRLAPTLITVALCWVMLLAGVALLGIGVLVAVPVSSLLALYYFRALTGRPLAA
ncbi:MAG: hypothetical protein WAW88_08890 [Nocardioides sp.]